MTWTTVTKHRRRRAPRPILGAISGLLLGGFVALDLQQFGVYPLNNLSVIGLPVIGLVLGIAIGATRPLGRRVEPPSEKVVYVDGAPAGQQPAADPPAAQRSAADPPAGESPAE